METNVGATAATEKENTQQYGKIKKPTRKVVAPPEIYINDRKKASYDLYTIGTKPQE